MQFYEIFSALLDSKNISSYKMWQDTAIPQAMIGRWKKGIQEPSLEKVKIIADYLDVSVDYLLGRTDNPEVNK